MTVPYVIFTFRGTALSASATNTVSSRTSAIFDAATRDTVELKVVAAAASAVMIWVPSDIIAASDGTAAAEPGTARNQARNTGSDAAKESSASPPTVVEATSVGVPLINSGFFVSPNVVMSTLVATAASLG